MLKIIAVATLKSLLLLGDACMDEEYKPETLIAAVDECAPCEEAADSCSVEPPVKRCADPAPAKEDCCKCCTTTEGIYIGGYFGTHLWRDIIGHENDTPAIIGQHTVDPGYNLALFAGYRYCCGIRYEAEVAYSYSDIKDIAIFGNTYEQEETASEFSTWSFMANVLFEGTYKVCDCCFFPYLGVGGGIAYVTMHASDVTSTFVVDGDDWAFAYQLMIGVAYPWNPCFDVGIEYRLYGLDKVSFNTGGVIYKSKEFSYSHNLLFTAKYVIGLWCP